MRVAGTSYDSAASAVTTSGTLTVPTGVVSTDYCLLIVGWVASTTNETPPTITPSGGSWTTLIAPRTDTNMGWAVFSKTGLVATNTFTVALSLSRFTTISHAYYQDTAGFGTPGSVTSRGGVSSADSTAPAITTTQDGQTVAIVAAERTTATGTTISSYTGNSPTTRVLYEGTSNATTSCLIADFTGPTPAGTTSSTTITYNSASGNGAAAQIGILGPAGTSAPAEATAATVTAYDATVTVSGTSAPAENAAATVTAYDAAVITGIIGNAEACTATGTAYDATVSLRAPAASAAVTGLAYNGWALHGQLKAWARDKGSMYVAHRGGSVDYVEMTANAYAACDARKVEAIEISVWRTSDSVWVGSHDQSTLRMFGTDIDIPTNPYSAISGLSTTTGGFPIAKLTDLLDLYAATHVVFVDNKSNANVTAFLDLLDTYADPTGHFVVKNFYTSTATLTGAKARGYSTWAYYYEVDLPNLDSTLDRGDLLGMQYDATGPGWAQIKATGKPVLGHVILTTANAATAFAAGADGVVTGVVNGVIPNAVPSDGPTTVTGTANDATITASGNAAPTTAAATGTAYDATVSTSAQTNAPAVEATATASALDAAAALLTSPATAAVTGGALDATVNAGSTGTAEAAAVGAAISAVIALYVAAEAALVTGQALDPLSGAAAAAHTYSGTAAVTSPYAGTAAVGSA